MMQILKNNWLITTLCLFTFSITACTTSNSNTNEILVEPNDNICEPLPNEWKCCFMTPKVHSLDNIKVCLDLKVIKQDIGLELKVTVNNFTIFDEEISVRNPPPICFDFFFSKKIGNMCIGFYNIVIDKHHFGGCIKVFVKFVHILKYQVKLGCYNFPIQAIDANKLLNYRSQITRNNTYFFISNLNQNYKINQQLSVNRLY